MHSFFKYEHILLVNHIELWVINVKKYIQNIMYVLGISMILLPMLVMYFVCVILCVQLFCYMHDCNPVRYQYFAPTPALETVAQYNAVFSDLVFTTY